MYDHFHNGSMMRHPMHLHGHDFRVINGQGDYAPLKNVIDIMPMETDTLEFAATERWRLVFSLSYFVSHDERNGKNFQLRKFSLRILKFQIRNWRNVNYLPMTGHFI